MYKTADNAHFHPIDEFDAEWSKRSIIDILCAYRWDVIKRITRHGKERDLIMRVYRAIDLAFDDLWVDVQRYERKAKTFKSLMPNLYTF